MNRNVGKIVVCAFVFTLTCASGGWAQQPQPSGGTPVSQATPPAAGVPAREQAPRRLQGMACGATQVCGSSMTSHG